VFLHLSILSRGQAGLKKYAAFAAESEIAGKSVAKSIRDFDVIDPLGSGMNFFQFALIRCNPSGRRRACRIFARSLARPDALWHPGSPP